MYIKKCWRIYALVWGQNYKYSKGTWFKANFIYHGVLPQTQNVAPNVTDPQVIYAHC